MQLMKDDTRLETCGCACADRKQKTSHRGMKAKRPPVPSRCVGTVLESAEKACSTSRNESCKDEGSCHCLTMVSADVFTLKPKEEASETSTSRRRKALARSVLEECFSQ